MSDELYDLRPTPGWFRVDNELLEDFGNVLGPYGIAVYNSLCKHANNTKVIRHCFPSYATIAAETGMSKRQAVRAMKNLVKFGIVVKERRLRPTPDGKKRNWSNIYTLMPKTTWGSADYTRGGDSQSLGSDSQSPCQYPLNNVKAVAGTAQKSALEPNDSQKTLNQNQEPNAKTMTMQKLLKEYVPEVQEPSRSRIAETRTAFEVVSWINRATFSPGVNTPVAFAIYKLLRDPFERPFVTVWGQVERRIASKMNERTVFATLLGTRAVSYGRRLSVRCKSEQVARWLTENLTEATLNAYNAVKDKGKLCESVRFSFYEKSLSKWIAIR